MMNFQYFLTSLIQFLFSFYKKIKKLTRLVPAGGKLNFCIFKLKNNVFHNKFAFESIDELQLRASLIATVLKIWSNCICSISTKLSYPSPFSFRLFSVYYNFFFANICCLTTKLNCLGWVKNNFTLTLNKKIL